MALSHLLVVLIAAVANWALLRALLPSFRRCLMDQPNDRSSHLQPTPRGGGATFVLVACLSSTIALFVSSSSASSLSALTAVPLLALPLAFVGLLDDRHNISPGLRYGVQLLTSFVAIFVSPLQLPANALFPLSVLLVIAVTGVINFTNFMDGMDGLVAGCMSVSISAAATKVAAPWPIWTLVGCLFGFLLWNWSPAKLFMGDVGSTFLGAVFAFLLLQAPSWSEALSLLLVATPFLGDACLCVLRRLIARQNVFQAHRLHLFQRLNQVGWSHSHISCLYIGATLLLAVALNLGGLHFVIALASCELLIGIWLDQHVAIPFVMASRSR